MASRSACTSRPIAPTTRRSRSTDNYDGDLAAFAAGFPGLPAPRTNRTHCIAWSDYDTQPQVALAHGIRFDTNYYYWPRILGE